jgi:hypothetical protein
MTVTYETRCDKVDWDNLKTEVITKLEYLRMAWAASEQGAPTELHRKIVNDLYVPAIRLLAEFCACLEVDEAPDDQ